MTRIFLHGLGQTAQSWERTLACLKDENMSVCLPLSEFVKPGAVTYPELYAALCEYCGGFSGPVELCGLSLGTVLALNYAIDNPEKVSSLALIAPQYRMPKTLLRFQTLVFHLMPKAAFRSTGFEKQDMIRLCGSMARLDFREDLLKVRCPVLVLCGEKDRANRKAARQLVTELKNARLCLIPHAGHEVNLDAPEELAKALQLHFRS